MTDKANSMLDKLASLSMEEQRTILNEIIAANTSANVLQALVQLPVVSLSWEDAVNYVSRVEE